MLLFIVRARRARSLAVCFALLCLTAVPVARAQPAPSPDSTAPTLADREPYTRWRVHTGSAADAVVHVRYTLLDTAAGKLEVREGSGFVIRCDGFVMLPAALLSRADRAAGLKEQEIVLTFAGADGPIPLPQTVTRPRFYNERYDFAVAKVNNSHFPGLQMLAPQNIRENMAVQVVFARPRRDRRSQAEAVTVAARVGKRSEDGKRWSFAGSAPSVPPGAVVVDAASGLALGIVPGTALEGKAPAPAATFVSFADLYQISNAVALLPDASARESGGGTASEKEEMVWVPGGPIALEGDLLTEYRQFYNTRVACTPGFSIDRGEVSADEYAAFVQATRAARPANSRRRPPAASVAVAAPDLPATGVSAADAAAYAAWRNKRLVTPVEWARASRGAYGPRIAQYQSALAEINVRLRALNQAEADYQRLILFNSSGPGGKPRSVVIPSDALERFAAEREAIADRYVSVFVPLFEIAPVGSRDWDISVYGVRDVAANVPELLLPNLSERTARSIKLAPKPLPATGDARAGLQAILGTGPGVRRPPPPPNRTGFRCAR